MKTTPIPLFEDWIENELAGCNGDDVLIPEEIELLGWVSNYSVNRIVHPGPDSKRVQLPAGAYIISGNNAEYVQLAPTNAADSDSYVVKRYDFEEIKNKIKT